MRKFLVVFMLKTPQPEHAQLRDRLEEYSRGDFKNAFIAPGAVGYLFSTELPMWQLDFSQALLAEDTMLMVEIGEAFTARHLAYAEDWLRRHLAPK